MISTGCPGLMRALAIGSLVLASVSVGCRDGDGPAGIEQTDPLVNAPFDARIAFSSTREGESHIYVATADGSQVKRLSKGTKPAWSPDGRWILFNTWDGSTNALRVIGVDGSRERVIAAPAGMGVWSPDGTKILFGSVVGAPNAGLFVVNPDGSGLTRVLSADFVDPPGNWLGYPAWSPDGKTIAFMRVNDYMFWPIYLVNADGSAPRELFAAGTVWDPSWSPDGTMLAGGLGNRTIATMNADGSGLQMYPPALAFDPDWSPDGRSLVFNAFSSPVGDSVSQVGSKMRIYVIDRQSLAVRQLIPDAVAPKNPTYWDQEPVWLRSTKAPAER